VAGTPSLPTGQYANSVAGYPSAGGASDYGVTAKDLKFDLSARDMPPPPVPSSYSIPAPLKSPDLAQSVEATIAVLASKLDEARAALVASRPTDAAAHVSLIKEIATAIAALRACA